MQFENQGLTKVSLMMFIIELVCLFYQVWCLLKVRGDNTMCINLLHFY